MMKHEFDRIGRDLGYGDCAPEMWDEIERVYMGAEKVSKEGICYAYWTGNGYYPLKDAVDALDVKNGESEGSRAVALVGRVLCKTMTADDVRKVVDEIALGINRNWEREGVKARDEHLAQVKRDEREQEREERARKREALAAEREKRRRERELARQMREDARASR